MAAAHTPGPWSPRFGETYSILDADGGQLAILTNLRGAHGLGGRRPGDEVAANARLIAASTELLKVAQAVAAIDMHGVVTWEQLQQLSDDAHVAIRKVTGEPT